MNAVTKICFCNVTHLNTDVDEAVHIDSQLHEVEEEGHVLLHGKVARGSQGESLQHLNHCGATLPGNHVLVEVVHILKQISC